MSPPRDAVEHQQQRAELSQATGRAARALWAQADPEDLERSWLAMLARVIALVTAGQLTAARQAQPWLQRALPGEPGEGEIQPEQLAGVSGDGRDLAGLLMEPVYVTLNRISRGFTQALSIASGAAFLEMLARTLVADIGRAADLVGMIARPAITSYVRVVELPACARCIILAGREYGLSTGFERHPQCDCTMAPVTRTHRPAPVDAQDVFRQMTAQQQRKTFGAAAVKAIEDGADIAQVVNARRGMTTATAYGRTVQATTEGITRRGLAGARLITGDPNALTAPRTGGDTQVVSEYLRRTRTGRQQLVRLRGARSPRLMPEEIYRLADDREHAIRLLRQHGYIV
ncbi:VG15 protein [Streptomyces hygroscopicus]|uniref:VG15 protein n=1 Tax=Streptomyces hygroscopicus TaxID=1912 RepID=UPI0033E5B889